MLLHPDILWFVPALPPCDLKMCPGDHWPMSSFRQNVNFFLKPSLVILRRVKMDLAPHGHLPNLLKNLHLGHSVLAFWNTWQQLHKPSNNPTSKDPDCFTEGSITSCCRSVLSSCFTTKLFNRKESSLDRKQLKYNFYHDLDYSNSDLLG